KGICYFDGLMLSMVICNPTDDKRGWIRVEPWSPFLETGNRPVFYIYARKHPSAFASLRDAYDTVWKEINAPGIANPLTSHHKEGSQT
ncbi:MAG: hypothetical protein AAB037_06230, partial [Chloroflexota bacterium]